MYPYSAEPPFALGQTYYNGRTIDSADLKGTELEGRMWPFPDLDYASAESAKPYRTRRNKLCMIVRNVGAAAILAKFACTPQKSGVNYLGRVDGLVRLDNDGPCFVADEYLPSAGCPVNDLMWVTVEGPTLAKTPMSGAAFNGDFAVGSRLVGVTAVTSGSTTAGRVGVINTTGSTQTADYAFLADIAHNIIGRALSAITTGQTNADVLIVMGKF